MTFNEFDKLQSEINARIAEISKTKGMEYCRSEDRLDNFKRIAARNRRLSPLDALHVLLTKHLDSIDSFVERGKVVSGERIQGRIVDAIHYLQLMYAIIEEMEIAYNSPECEPVRDALLRDPDSRDQAGKIGYGNLAETHDPRYIKAVKGTTFDRLK